MKFTESRSGKPRSAGLDGIRKFVTARSTACWFPLVSGRERSIRDRKMPWNGLDAPPTLRLEDCARRWTKPASKASALGGQREPLAGAHKGASLFPNPKGGRNFFASGSMSRAGRKNDHSFRSVHLN